MQKRDKGFVNVAVCCGILCICNGAQAGWQDIFAVLGKASDKVCTPRVAVVAVGAYACGMTAWAMKLQTSLSRVEQTVAGNTREQVSIKKDLVSGYTRLVAVENKASSLERGSRGLTRLIEEDRVALKGVSQRVDALESCAWVDEVSSGSHRVLLSDNESESSDGESEQGEKVSEASSSCSMM